MAEEKKSSGCAVWVLGSLLVILILIVQNNNSDPTRPAPETHRVAPDPAQQQQRRDLVDKLIAKGVFHKVDLPKQPGELPHVWVTPLFLSLDFNDKQNFISVVYGLYYPAWGGTANQVVLVDSKTGKQVGTLDSSGLHME